MLFIAVHRHTAESCPAGDPAGWHQVIDPKHAAACGVRVHGNYTAPPEHVSFHVLEAETYEAVVRYFRPVLEYGAIDIVPVQRMQDAAKLFPTKRQQSSGAPRSGPERASPERKPARRPSV